MINLIKDYHFSYNKSSVITVMQIIMVRKFSFRIGFLFNNDSVLNLTKLSEAFKNFQGFY